MLCFSPEGVFSLTKSSCRYPQLKQGCAFHHDDAPLHMFNLKCVRLIADFSRFCLIYLPNVNVVCQLTYSRCYSVLIEMLILFMLISYLFKCNIYFWDEISQFIYISKQVQISLLLLKESHLCGNSYPC